MPYDKTRYQLDNEYKERVLRLSHLPEDTLWMLDASLEDRAARCDVRDAIARRRERDYKDAQDAYYKKLGIY